MSSPLLPYTHNDLKHFWYLITFHIILDIPPLIRWNHSLDSFEIKVPKSPHETCAILLPEFQRLIRPGSDHVYRHRHPSWNNIFSAGWGQRRTSSSIHKPFAAATVAGGTEITQVLSQKQDGCLFAASRAEEMIRTAERCSSLFLWKPSFLPLSHFPARSFFFLCLCYIFFARRLLSAWLHTVLHNTAFACLSYWSFF